MKKPNPEIVVPDAKTKKRLTISLGRLLALSFGGLVALSVGVVLAMSVSANYLNTFSLLNARAIDLFDDMERQIKADAGAVEQAASIIASLYGEGKIDLGDTRTERATTEALLKSLPVVEGIFLFSGDTLADALLHRRGDVIVPPPLNFTDKDLAKLFSIDAARSSDGPVWGNPTQIGSSIFYPVTQQFVGKNGQEGFVTAVIGRGSIVRAVSQLGKDKDVTVFLLTDKDAVVGHSGMSDVFRGRGPIPLADFPDENLKKMNEATVENEGFGRASEHGIKVLVSRGTSGGYLYMIKELTGYGVHGFKLGVYFPKADIGAEVLRTRNSMFAGAAGLLVAVLAAMLLGRYMSRPMAQIARTASQFSRFELDDITPVPRSRVREVDEQAVALNRMRTTLQQFTRYVPRELVARLMRSGSDVTRPVEREMTILFSDIVGFTSLSERMSAAEVTAQLNQHFAMITRQVEETRGTIDKFLGDGVMAFWGAPEADEHHVAHAVHAAEAIVRSTRKENAARRERGEAVLRLRIGIHTGRVVVGNIGGDDRQNYTIIGDAVNVAQRLEQMARDIMGRDDDAVVLISVDVAKAVEGEAVFIPVGTKIVRGRERPIGVCILEVDGAKAAGNVVPFTGSEA